MSASLRMVIVGCALVLLGIGVFSLRFACDLPDFQEEFRSARLAEMRQNMLTRLEARDQVARDLIAQQCTLAQAIEQFLRLDQEWSASASKALADQSPQEKSYHYIRSIVEDVLHDQPEQASIVLRRLEREYDTLRSEGHLPSTTETKPVETSPANTKREGR
ncbi:MAG TPA: hypothetical protein VE999_05445 [Gemmataceae bacterium]|nr:hypothetical protein [Gemmataceae bacterium]